jgi:hypothetical protein
VERPLDLDDPHAAAIEDNPHHAEKVSVTTFLAIIVRQTLIFCINYN